MATVELNAVKKRFGSTEVIHGVTTAIADGEFIVIVGPSGCGKSTLLRMVAGLETVSEGEVKIGGNRVNELEPMDRDIAMVFQNYALYPHMSVRENMGYGLKIAKLPKTVIDEKVQAAAKLLQLEDFLDRRPRNLSGGQRQTAGSDAPRNTRSAKPAWHHVAVRHARSGRSHDYGGPNDRDERGSRRTNRHPA